MSKTYYDEYKDLYIASQTDKSKAKYKMFLFDVKSSKTHSKREGVDFYYALEKFLNKITADLLNLEKVKGHKILHRHVEVSELKEGEVLSDKVVLAKTQDDRNINNLLFRYDQINPLFWMGDLMHFTVNAGSISDDEIMKIIKDNKDNIIPNYDLHFASGYYETDVWAESSEKFSRVYCIAVLEELSKKNKPLTTEISANKSKERQL